jgi:hypothetical protein
MSALDTLREVLESVESAISDVDTENEDLRSAMDAARTALKDAATEVRTAAAKVQAIGNAVRQLFEADGDEPIPQEQIMTELDKLGGPDSGEYGPLDDLATTADSLESAADDVTGALGNGDEQQAQQGQAAAQ